MSLDTLLWTARSLRARAARFFHPAQTLGPLEVALLSPDAIFDTPPPPHPSAPAVPRLEDVKSDEVSERPSSTSMPVPTFTEAGIEELQQTLRWLHKRKVPWPADESYLVNLPPERYVFALLSPVADVFNALRPRNMLDHAMRCEEVTVDNLSGVAFYARVSNTREGWSGELKALVVLLQPGLLVGPSQQPLPHVVSTAHELLSQTAGRGSVIITNLTDILAFRRPNWPPNSQLSKHEFVQANLPALALRGVAMAYLDRSTQHQYLVPPDRYEGPYTFHVLPEGPPVNPDVPLPSDSELLLNLTRCSHFDLATAARNLPHALQFFRWHQAARNSALQNLPQAGVTVRGVTYDISPVLFVPKPQYPLDPAQIPADTRAHIDAIRRPSPLTLAGLDAAFAQSKSFDLHIDELIAKSEGRSMCTVYRCHLVALDGTMIKSAPSLCLKLFDDRIQTLRYPLPEEPWGREWGLSSLFAEVRVAEHHALDEKLAYDKMGFVQGSLVPWFFGMHRFTLPDGLILHGLLMEFVEGCRLDSDLARGMAAEEQIQVIQSARHGSRILDLSDIAQYDWHEGQMLLVSQPGTELRYVVLIDFASTLQTIDPDDRILLDNYSGMLGVLSDEQCGVHLDEQLVWKYFGEPDRWDGVCNPKPDTAPDDHEWITAKSFFTFTVSHAHVDDNPQRA